MATKKKRVIQWKEPNHINTILPHDLLAQISLDPFSKTGSIHAVPVMIGMILQFMDEARRGALNQNYGVQEGNANVLREVQNL
jgi:hypothetical protein